MPNCPTPCPNCPRKYRVLDPGCGSRMMYTDRSHPSVVFGDNRQEIAVLPDKSSSGGMRLLMVNPDVLMDFRLMPYRDNTFSLVVFDPPHVNNSGTRSWLTIKYGKLGVDWRDDLRAGFSECFRVLHPSGTLIFKWNETKIKTSEVLALTPNVPLFWQRSGQKLRTHWIVFLKDI